MWVEADGVRWRVTGREGDDENEAMDSYGYHSREKVEVMKVRISEAERC